MTVRRHYCLLGALLLGFVLRIPGIFWGFNYPTGWSGHHVDEYTHLVTTECLINPALVKWCSPYPKGMATHVALPLITLRMAEGKLSGALPPPKVIIVLGRVVSVLYGTATILVVFLLAECLFRDPRIPPLSALIFALGGLHVTQSHFFLADVPSLFWLLLGLYLLARELQQEDKVASRYINWAALSFGAAFGLKLTIAPFVSLVLITLLHPPRLRRMAYVTVFFVAGLSIVTFCSYSPYDIYKMWGASSFTGSNGAYHFSRLAGAALYLIELPSIVSFPVFIMAAAGAFSITWKLVTSRADNRLRTVVIIVVIPLAVNMWLVIVKMDHFPRHLLILIPWIAIVAAWSLSRMVDQLASKSIPSGWIILALFAYLGAFVYDSERHFWDEPRNKAEQWILQNVPRGTLISWFGSWWGMRPSSIVPGYNFAKYPQEPKPEIIVCEMHFANYFLSGMSWRNSYPSDYRRVFGMESQRQLEAWQSLFRGTSDYRECARFGEGYFMPEYLTADRLIGNQSRSYVAEVVIFGRKGAADSNRRLD